MIQRLQLADAPAFAADVASEPVVAVERPKRLKWQLRIRIVWWRGDSPMAKFSAGVTKTLQWLQEKRKAQIAAKRLRVCETVSLGEKRFLSLVQVDGKQFLIGGAPNSVSMLAQLDSVQAFNDVLKQQMLESGK